MLRLHARQLLAVDHPDDPIDTCGNTAGKIAGLEFRRDDLVDDPLGGDVGQRALKAVTDLDAEMAVVLGNDDQRTVIDLLAADLPGFGHPQRELLDRLAIRGRNDQYRDLAALPGLEIPQGLVQRGDVAAAERAGLVDDAPHQRRYRDIGQSRSKACRQGRENPAQQQRKQNGFGGFHGGQILMLEYLLPAISTGPPASG